MPDRPHQNQSVTRARHVQICQQHVEALGCDQPQRLHHVASRGHLEFVRFENDAQSSKDCLVIIHEQQSYGSQGLTPLVPVAHRRSVPPNPGGTTNVANVRIFGS